MKKTKIYVVWNGVKPGIYHSWTECKAQIDHFKGALYRSFDTIDQAREAYNDNPRNYISTSPQKNTADPTQSTPIMLPIEAIPEIEKNSLAVDAACSGNPGLVEYRGVHVKTKEQLFHVQLGLGTNNIGEFLALVHGLAFLKQNNNHMPIYSDSANAISWVKQKKCKTKLEQTPQTKNLFETIARAERWLKENNYTTPIIKWQTNKWGEIPADFGRKK